MGYTGTWQTEWVKTEAGEMKRTYGGRTVSVLPNGTVWAKTSRANNMVRNGSDGQEAGMKWADGRYSLKSISEREEHLRQS